MDPAATYGGDLTKDLDWIRFQIGDTDINAALLSDAEIQSLLTIYSSKNKAAIDAMEHILVKLSQECDYKIGPESVSASKRYEQYQQFYLTKKKTLSNKSIQINPEDTTGIFDIGMMDNQSDTSGVI